MLNRCQKEGYFSTIASGIQCLHVLLKFPPKHCTVYAAPKMSISGALKIAQ